MTGFRKAVFSLMVGIPIFWYLGLPKLYQLFKRQSINSVKRGIEN